MFDLKLLAGLVTLESFAGDHDSTAFVLRGTEAGGAARCFPSVAGNSEYLTQLTFERQKEHGKRL